MLDATKLSRVTGRGAGPHNSPEDLPCRLVQRETLEFVRTGGQFFPATLQILHCSTYNATILLSGLSKSQSLVQVLLCSLLS